MLRILSQPKHSSFDEPPQRALLSLGITIAVYTGSALNSIDLRKMPYWELQTVQTFGCIYGKEKR